MILKKSIFCPKLTEAESERNAYCCIEERATHDSGRKICGKVWRNQYPPIHPVSRNRPPSDVFLHCLEESAATNQSASDMILSKPIIIKGMPEDTRGIGGLPIPPNYATGYK